MARALVKRGACHSWLSNYKDAVADFERIINSEEYSAVLGENDIKNIKKDLEIVKAREESQ